MRAPSLADVQRLAEREIQRIPRHLRAAAGNVAVHVVDFPDEETMTEMALESEFDLLGLYVGVALTERSVTHPRSEPDMVYLYRRPILDYWCETGETLAAVVRHVLVHEIGHHFGYSDDEMDALQGPV
ncbi:MAG: metallopeptidase family protein [Acidobacteria bacterium]|nr:metallopeptidase family protein [Acidobacteriota bacterium]